MSTTITCCQSLWCITIYSIQQGYTQVGRELDDNCNTLATSASWPLQPDKADGCQQAPIFPACAQSQ
jgi:hypothetical protein